MVQSAAILLRLQSLPLGPKSGHHRPKRRPMKFEAPYMRFKMAFKVELGKLEVCLGKWRNGKKNGPVLPTRSIDGLAERRTLLVG